MKNLKMEKMIKEWNEKREEYGKTLNDGVKRVLNAYHYSNTYEYLLIDDGWEQHAKDMIDFIKECGIEKFMFSDTSTEATKLLKVFIENGAMIRKVVKISKNSDGTALLLEL